MTRFLVRGESAGASLKTSVYDTTITVKLYEPSATASFQVWNVTNAIVHDLSPRLRDLLEIGAYIYIADTEAVRWSPRDVLNKKWVRHIDFALPVLDRDFWEDPAVTKTLTQAVELATGDKVHFQFETAQPRAEQLFYSFSQTPFPAADSVCLFSGGADSAAGVLHLVESLGVTPLLVSHRSSPTLDSRQENVLTVLNARNRSRSLGHVSMWLHRKGTEARETSQRSRGFLFLSLAGAVAKQLGLSHLFVPENGFVSLNVRKLQQSYSTTLSQTTHPSFLRAFQNLLDLIGGATVAISNPFVFRTKAEVLSEFTRYNAEPLFQETISCAHTQGQSRVQPHCGVCSQCIDRRFAAIVSGLEPYDLPERYETDIFASDVPEGEKRMQVESHLRLASRIADLSDDALATETVELVTAAAALPGSAPDNAKRLLEMLRRFSDEASRACAKKWNEMIDLVLAGKLPEHSVLRIAASGEHLHSLPEHVAVTLGDLLCQGLPPIFATRQATDERQVQDAAEGLLVAKAPSWLREGPMLPFSVVKTKPDFSNAEPTFFLEIKYPKDRSRLNHVMTEITSRIHIYGQQGAAVLFAIYDPARTITDDKALVDGLGLPETMFARVVR